MSTIQITDGEPRHETWHYNYPGRENVEVVIFGTDAVAELLPLWHTEKDRKDEELANARLFVAAKKLFEVALMTVDSQSWDGNDPDEERWSLLYSKAREAVQEVRGEAST